MLNIPDEVKGLFKLDSCRKNFRVHFPNGEMDDLTNANMVQESVEFSESICSQNTFKFGLSESSTISFETVGVPNMIGDKIECAIEIDCTSLGSTWAAEHPVDNTLPFLTPQTLWVYSGEGQTNEYTQQLVSFFNDGNSVLNGLSVPITPTQNLNGYSKPWAGGAGVNLFPDALPANAFAGSISSAGVIGTATNSRIFYFPCEKNTDYTFTKNTTGSWTGLAFADSEPQIGDTVDYRGSMSSRLKWTQNSGNNTYIVCVVGSVSAFNDLVTTKEAMIVKGSTEQPYSPYSNICPITGSTGLSVYVSPTQDQQDATTYALSFTEVLAGSIDPVLGAIKRRPVYSSYNGETLVGPWLSSLDEYASGTTPTTGAQVVDLGGLEIPESVTPTAISILMGQNYIWASNGGTITAVVFEQDKKMYYRVPYGLFVVRSCPRDHKAMTHRKVSAYTETKELVTDYQKALLQVNGFEKKYTPKFQNMFCSVAGRNNEVFLTAEGYTRALHVPLSDGTVYTGSYVREMFSADTHLGHYFKIDVDVKSITIYSGDASQYNEGYTQDAVYGLEGIENIKNNTLIDTVGDALVSEYGISESVAHKIDIYEDAFKSPSGVYNFNSRLCATPAMSKAMIIIGLKKKTDSQTIITHTSSSPKIDIGNVSGLYTMNPDREGVATRVSYVSGITVTEWSSDNLQQGHAIGTPIVASAQGLDSAYLNQYMAPSGAAFELELNLSPTGTDKTGEIPRYSFTDAVDLSKLCIDYLEINGLFAAQNRAGGIRILSLDNSSPVTLLPSEYSEFWWDEYDISPIGKIKYNLYGKNDKQETKIYDFGDGQSTYDMTANEFFKEFMKTQSEVEDIFSSSFVPQASVVAFTPIDLSIGNGLPYIEAGDYVWAVSEDEVTAKSFVLTQTISGIQHLTHSIESSGGSLTGTTEGEN